MKTISWLLVFLFFAISMSRGQTQEKSPTVKFLNKRGYRFPAVVDPKDTIRKTMNERTVKWPDTLYYNTVYKSTLLGSPTIPISFSRVEFVDGKYQVSPTISLGYGYTWFFGHFIFNENDKLTVDPTFFFGLIADIALQNDFNLKKPAGFFTGGFLGTQAFSIFSGYDFVTQSFTLGLGGRIDVFTISQKSLRPFGKVKELRRHKRLAMRIEDE